MRLRIRSIKNIAQVTRALEAVSASKVRRAIQAVTATRPYAEKAWKVLVHLARQPGHTSLHPLLKEPASVDRVLVILITSDRGLAGPYNINIVRHALEHFIDVPYSVRYVGVGRKGRDMLMRRRREVIAEFSGLPAAPSFADVSAIGHLAIDEFLSGESDEVYLAYTDFHNMVSQVPILKKLLPLKVDPQTQAEKEKQARASSQAVFTYEPDQTEILDQIITRFTEIQVYQAILTSIASEHAARMVAMRNATDNAKELTGILQLEYNKARQQTITSEMIDITSGAEALSK
jgi:F-type H+-transporting ATPase subunit gamma